jgi:hypothetical protein
VGQSLGEVEEGSLLAFLCLESAFNQIDDDAVCAGAATFRKRLDSPRDWRREADTLTDALL